MSKQTHHFQAEVSELLHLVTHSLYSNPEIFLREFISNASDAADKLRFEAIAQPALLENQPQLEIRIETNKTDCTLTISDNGIGMSESEVVEHLGTIAKSGTKAFLQNLSKDQKADAQLIGQFGVGFYSGFIVAQKIVVESRRAGLEASQGVRWSSSGSGDFEVETIEKADRGTRITLHLREDASEFLDLWRLKQIISKYSDHIDLSILLPKEEWDKDKSEMVRSGEWETVNQANALWTRPKKDITQAQYQAFYEHLTHDNQAPWAYSHNRVEGKTEYTQLLFIPAKAPFDLYQRDLQHGLKLYVRRVFIMDEAEALLPNYLRFVKGVIDSADLPLNVSRELLQENKEVKAIRSGNTHRVLSLLEEIANTDIADTVDATNPADVPDGTEASKTAKTNSSTASTTDSDTAAHKDQPQPSAQYADFYREFGAVLKEGLGEDFNNRERIAKLLRFASTQSAGTSVALATYKKRMQAGQEAIYYLIAESLATAQNSPQLEVFKKKGIEVLLLADRVDEWAMGYLHEFDGTPLKSVAKGAVDLGTLQDEDEKKATAAAADSAKDMVEKLKATLSEQAKDVRVTARLVDSPACLVVEDGEYSMQLARLLQQAGQKTPEVKPILEINPEHALVQRLKTNMENDAAFNDLAHIVFDQAMLAEGGLPADAAAYVQRVNKLLINT